MRQVQTAANDVGRAINPRSRWVRLSAMQLLAAGALCVAGPARSAVVTNAFEFANALNDPNDDDVVITGGDIDLSGQSFTLTVDQTGTPTYTIENGGVLSLNADLADTTLLTIDSGGLVNLNNIDQVLASIAGGGDINLGGAVLTVGDATDTTLSGVISGMGSLTKVGTGNLTLSGSNTYSGATTLSEGTLTVDGALTNTSAVSLAAGTTLTLNGDLADNAAVALAAGATLDLNNNNETLGTISGAGDITLGFATLTVGNGSNFTFDGTPSETGGLIKQGSGTMTLSAAQTYTGLTILSGGTLAANGDLATSGVIVGSGATFILESTMTSGTADVTVAAGGTLYGTGTIGNDLTSNGTVTFVGPGAGDTLTVNGDYTQGATGTLRVQLGSGGGLFVTGAADVDGTLDISIPADPANFDISATYNVVNAGSVTGTFATVTDNFAFLDLTNNNVGGNIEVTLARNAVAFSDISRTANQRSVADVLDGLGTPTGNLDSAIDRVLASSEAGARSTYDQLAGAGAATASTQIAASAVNQSHRVLDHVTGVAPGSTRPPRAITRAPGMNDFDDTDHLTLFSFYQGPIEDDRQSDDSFFKGLNPTPWAAFYGGFGDQGDGAQGLDFTRYGLLAGLEVESDESGARYGLSLGFELSDFDFNQDNGDIDITSIYLSGFTRQPLGNNYHVTLTGALGYHTHDSTRNILIGVTPDQAKADFDSQSVSLAAELSKAFYIDHLPVDPGAQPTRTSIEPFVRLDYSISMQDGYRETGAGTAGLNVDSADFDSIRAALGVRVQHQYMMANRREAVLQGRALVNAAIDNSDSGLNVSFVNTPGSGFAIEGSDQDDLFGQVGVGLAIDLYKNWDIHFDIDQQFSDSATATVIAGGLRLAF